MAALKKARGARSVKCPHCEAGPNYSCRGADGYPIARSHEARSALYATVRQPSHKIPPGEPKAPEIAARINRHLRRFERDPEINVRPGDGRLKPYYNASAWAVRGRVKILYVSFQVESTLTRDAAKKYLAWLDAGNVGHDYESRHL